MTHVPHREEPESANNDQCHGDEIQRNVVGIVEQGVIASEDIESGVVECRPRMEQSIACSFQRRVISYEHKEAQDGPGDFVDQRESQKDLQEIDQTAHATEVHCRGQDLSGFQADFPSHDQGDHDRQRCHTQAADLDQHTENRAAEEIEGVPRRNGGESRHADRAAGHKQRIEEMDMLPGVPGDRHCQ